VSKRRSQRWGPHQRSGNGARLVLALAVLLVTAVPARAVVAPLTADIVEELRFREEFGLETNLDYVLAVISDPASNHEDYPVHLSPEERAELDARRAIAVLWTRCNSTVKSTPSLSEAHTSTTGRAG